MNAGSPCGRAASKTAFSLDRRSVIVSLFVLSSYCVAANCAATVHDSYGARSNRTRVRGDECADKDLARRCRRREHRRSALNLSDYNNSVINTFVRCALVEKETERSAVSSCSSHSSVSACLRFRCDWFSRRDFFVVLLAILSVLLAMAAMLKKVKALKQRKSERKDEHFETEIAGARMQTRYEHASSYGVSDRIPEVRAGGGLHRSVLPALQPSPMTPPAYALHTNFFSTSAEMPRYDHASFEAHARYERSVTRNATAMQQNRRVWDAGSVTRNRARGQVC